MLVGGVGWYAWSSANTPVRWQDVGYTVPSATEATVTYDVFLYSDSPVTCHLRALNVGYAEVGVTTQIIDPADGKNQRLTAVIATTEEANTAVVNYCEPTS